MIFKTRLEISLGNSRNFNDTSGRLSLKRIERPAYETYRDLHNKVGRPYKWDLRPRINDRRAIKALLSKKEVELWEFYNDDILIGYALLTCGENFSAELEDFGFFPEYCGCGYGKFFLPKILQRFEQLGMKKVWLTTRSTNHPKVVSFYEMAGFRIVGQETISERVI